MQRPPGLATFALNRQNMRLQNGYIQATIEAKGAELKSLKRIGDDHEYMWRADPAYWAKTSPILFPIVGALKENTYQYEGRIYELPRHGFARDHVFDATRLADNRAEFILKDTIETRQRYPFAFQLTLRYELVENTLYCTYVVHNPHHSERLLFSVGGHPAFAVGGTGDAGYEDYFLEFPDDDELHCHLLERNLIADEVELIPLDRHRLPLRHSLFYRDALVLKSLGSHTITLKNHINGRGVRFSRDGFPYVGIWAAKDADFVCLEPWCGIADSAAHNQRFEEKEGIQRLAAGESWQRTWEVTCL